MHAQSSLLSVGTPRDSFSARRAMLTLRSRSARARQERNARVTVSKSMREGEGRRDLVLSAATTIGLLSLSSSAATPAAFSLR